MSRVQLALNVSDLDRAIAFYAGLFGVAPAKVRPGYANLAVDDPPLKLVLFEGGAPGTINHLGVEVATSDEVARAAARLAARGLATRLEDGAACCHARQDKVWVEGPDAEPWEVYAVLEHLEEPAGEACCRADGAEVAIGDPR